MQISIAGKDVLCVVMVDPQTGLPINSLAGTWTIQKVPGVTSGGAPVVVADSSNHSTLWMMSAADLAAKEVTLPAALPAGKFVYVGSDHAVGTLTFTANVTILNYSPGPLTANQVRRFQKLDATTYLCLDQ